MLVSNETNKVGGASQLMRELISSCYQAQEKFRSAAAVSNDGTLKRLFEIYAQQRTRFAQELREHLALEESREGDQAALPEWSCASEDSLRNCLDSDSRTLELYRQALASGDLPTRTQFLIASQLALLERAHDRVNDIVKRPEVAARATALNSGRARA